jgi:hypothetical protein
MSIFHIVYPVQAALPAAQSFFSTAAAVARPVFGAGALMTVLMVFRPLVVGVLQAIGLLLRPRLSLEERENRRALRSTLMLNRMARDFDQTQPNQAAELRYLATRD